MKTASELRRRPTTENGRHRRPLTTTQASDEGLLERYRSEGDVQAFNELVRRYERELYTYLRRYLGNTEMAEDVFQATFLQVHAKAESFDASRKFRPWLYTIATNQAIDAKRRNKRHNYVSLDRRSVDSEGVEGGSLRDLLVADTVDPEAALDLAESGNRLQRAMTTLPDGLRAAVTLVYFQGLKYREAAEILGIPVGTVKSRLHSAIEKLGAACREERARQNGDEAESAGEHSDACTMAA